MKKIKRITTVVLSICMLSTASCKNDDDTTTDPIDQLPPASQTGGNTFGCLLDGEVFLPGPGPLTLDCVYQFVDGGYYFTLQANKRDADFNLIGLACLTENLQIFQDQAFLLEDKGNGKAYGSYFYALNQTITSQVNTGELKITKLDLEKNIVSGTFWYDIKDYNEEVHEIREGRFDMKFTQ